MSDPAQARAPLAPEVQLEVMNDLIEYVLERCGGDYNDVTGVLYCTLVNLVVAQYPHDLAKAARDLCSVSKFYNDRLLAEIPVPEGAAN